VLAINVDTAAFGDAAAVDRRGRYALELPRGKWALRSSVIALDRPYASFTSARIATKAGQRRSLPLTLKRFKKPRKARRKRRAGRADVANVNPRDGRSYPGEAVGFEAFAVSGVDPELRVLGRGVPDMLITDVLASRRCEYTVVEWMQRDAVVAENAFSGSEYVDPATRIEPGHLIDPEILVRGRVEERPGTPKRVAQIAWLVDARSKARLSGDVSTVSLHDASVFDATERLAVLIERDLICARAAKPAPAPPPPAGSPPTPPPPPPSPPLPPAPPDAYTGTFSGEAVSESLASEHWDWSGTVTLDAANDSSPFFPPPNGAPPGTYRTFTATSGTVTLSLVATGTSDCTFTGAADFPVDPGLLNTLTLQLDVPNPAYTLRIGGNAGQTLPVTGTGSECPAGPTVWPIFPIWASTGTLAHTSPSLALADSQAELTPETPFDHDYTTRWNLTPG
jgi:hypothetical protein